MRSFIGGDDVRLERARLVQPAQRSVHGRAPPSIQPAFTQPAENVVAVAVLLGEHRQDRKIQDALEQLARVDRTSVDCWLHCCGWNSTTYCELVQPPATARGEIHSRKRGGSVSLAPTERNFRRVGCRWRQRHVCRFRVY